MAQHKKSPKSGKKAQRRELAQQIKHPYITGQGLQRGGEDAEDKGRSVNPGSRPRS